MAPPSAEFQEVLTNMRQGGSARQGGVSSDRKSRLRFAVSEAILRRARQQLARPRCVALFRDERMLVRYRACLDDLTVVSGVLGLKRAEGSGACLTQTTKMILEEFATPFHGLPRSCCAPEDQDSGDQKLRAVQDTLREKVSILVLDAAASVLLSGEMLRGRRVEAKSGAATADFPNVRVVGRARRPRIHAFAPATAVSSGCPQDRGR